MIRGKSYNILLLQNWGLHDLKRPDRNSPVQVELAQYKENLEKLARQIQGAAPKVLFLTTTPVPQNAHNRLSKDLEPYNEAACAVMKSLQIPMYDLHAHALKNAHLHVNAEQENDVHFTDEGYKRLGEFVADAISKELNTKGMTSAAPKTGTAG